MTWIQLEAAPSWAWALGILTLSQVTWLSYVLVTVIYVSSWLDIVGYLC